MFSLLKKYLKFTLQSMQIFGYTCWVLEKHVFACVISGWKKNQEYTGEMQSAGGEWRAPREKGAHQKEWEKKFVMHQIRVRKNQRQKKGAALHGRGGIRGTLGGGRKGVAEWVTYLDEPNHQIKVFRCSEHDFSDELVAESLLLILSLRMRVI